MKETMMRTKLGKIASGVALVMFMAVRANATLTPLNITVDAAGALLHGVGVADSTQYAPGNNNPSSNLSFLLTEIGRWNGVPLSPVLPAAGALALDQGSLTGNSYSGPSGYQYVVFHFGAGQAGGGQVSPGGYWEAFYLNGAAINLPAVPQVGGQDVGGFSSARYFGTVVPEPSTYLAGVLLLLPLGVSTMRILRKSRKA